MKHFEARALRASDCGDHRGENTGYKTQLVYPLYIGHANCKMYGYISHYLYPLYIGHR